jgi:hypothetical protein
LLRSAPPALGAPAPQQLQAAYGQLPLHFEQNRGQSDPQVKFLARGLGYALFLTPTEAVLSLRGAKAGPAAASSAAVLRMKLVGARPEAEVRGAGPLPGQVNYFRGRDPAKWYRHIPTYAQVRYEEVYPGIDLVYYGQQRQLEYDFVVAPEADPRRIRLGFEGTAGTPRLEGQGSLVLPLASGEVRLHKPVLYQEVDGQRREVAGRYVLHPEADQTLAQVGFEVADYDRTRPLVIDPVLVYSTYLGGSHADAGLSIAVDETGSAYITGETSSTDFPTTATVPQPTLAGARDAFVTKLSADGTALVYSTYLGGSAGDRGLSIAVDGAGQAYVTGATESTDFPTQNALQPTFGGVQDAFVTKLSADGATLLYSTYGGGSGAETGTAIAVDEEGQAYVTGSTTSADLPALNAFDSTLGGTQDAFVAKLTAEGTAVVYATYLGGSASETGAGIAVDGEGQAYVTGSTDSADFPTQNALQPTFGGVQDAFVTKLSADGAALLYSTYGGGSGAETGTAIAVDEEGHTTPCPNWG